MPAVEIEATNHCNTHCLHCPRKAITRPHGTMSWDVFQAVTDKIMSYQEAFGFDTVSFSGMGEPTLNPLLPRFVSYLSDKFITYMTTCASTLSHDKIQELIDAGLGNIIVSFSGHNAETYELMSGGLSFEKTISVIQDLVRLGDKKTRVLANVSVTLQTQPHLFAIKNLLNNFGVQEIFFSQCHNRGGFLRDNSICETPLPPVGAERCDIFADTLFVAWSGEVLACCHDLRGEGRLGNLVTDGLGLILETKQQIVREGVQFPMCKDCNDMYRFSHDPTPDGQPLSEWIYSLYASKDTGADRLARIIRQKEQAIRQKEIRIRELENVVAAYERGRFIRMMRRLKQMAGSIRSFGNK